MPQYQGVWTLEAQAQAQSNQQWVTDPNFKNTTLLLQADGTGSGSQNNTFLDGSTNNFFITRNGNTTQGSFSPFSQAPGYWSNYFNGGSTLSAASNSAFNILAYDTFECWVNMSVLGSNDLIAGRDGNFWLGYNHTSISGTANKFVFSIWNGSSWQAVSSTTTPTVGVWYHILGVKDNTTLRFYVNGVQENTATFSGTPVTTGTFYVASNNNTENLEGYVSNLRLITGASNAVFPYAGLTTGAAFTPQTTPLTAVSSTQLLTCQTNRFVDNSTNAFALTAVSVPSVQGFGPFAPALQWTPDVVGGSGYFDGSGDYLVSAGTVNWSTYTNLTVELWVYPTNLTGSTSTLQAFVGTSHAQNDGYTIVYTYNDGKVAVGINGTNEIVSAAGAIKANTWSHVAVVKVGSTTTIYVNGVSVTSNTTGVWSNNSATVYVANTNTQLFTGYISSLRLTLGSAVYTTAFTPPTSPPTAITNTQLLLNYTNAGIYDGKMGSVAETVGNAQVATSPVKYGSGSIAFDGTGDYLIMPNSPIYDFGTGDFTIEGWVYVTSTSASRQTFIGRGVNGGASFHIALETTGNWIYYLSSNNSTWNIASAVNIGTNRIGVWQHIALVRAGTVFTPYLNGIAGTTTTSSSAIYWSSASAAVNCITVGATEAGTQTLFGFIDDLRITKGVCRYFTTFTPPQQALPRQ